uniref:Putative secreted protein n=1 Tax=Anopheles marajoara TaxID=58244 RepID=A0A2M4CBL8_9DIPT
MSVSLLRLLCLIPSSPRTFSTNNTSRVVCLLPSRTFRSLAVASGYRSAPPAGPFAGRCRCRSSPSGTIPAAPDRDPASNASPGTC